MANLLRPSDHARGPDVVLRPNRQQMDRVLELPLEQLADEFQPPPKCEEDRVSMRGIPAVWWNCLHRKLGVSFRYISLRAYAEMMSDTDLLVVRDALFEARDNDNTGGYLAVWLERLPVFVTTLPTGDNKHALHGWSEMVREEIVTLADDCAVTARSLVLVYGARAILSSTSDLGDSKDILEAEVKAHKVWVNRMAKMVGGFRRL